MIGVSDLTPLCVACGVELTDVDDNDDGACSPCFAESRAKAAAQQAKERAEQFRYLSNDWFCIYSPVALERKAASYEEPSYYADNGSTFSERRAAQYSEGK
jgi:hypothetical protein